MPLTLGQHAHTAPWEHRQRWIARVGGLAISTAALLAITVHPSSPVRDAILVVDAPAPILVELLEPLDALEGLTEADIPQAPQQGPEPADAPGAMGQAVADATEIGPAASEAPAEATRQAAPATEPTTPSELPELPKDAEVRLERADGAAAAARSGTLSRSGFLAGQMARMQQHKEKVQAAKTSPFDEQGNLRAIKRVSPRYNGEYMRVQPMIHECHYDVTVDPAGMPVDIQVRQCPGPLKLAALQAVREWRWATREGEDTLEEVQVLLRFHPPKDAVAP